MSKFDIDKEIRRCRRQFLYIEIVHGLGLTALFICAFAVATSLFL